MQSGSGPKNPPWARSNVNTNMTGMNPQIMDPNAMMTQQGMMQFQQTQAVFNPSMMQAQSGMAMPMAGQMPMNQMAQGQMYPGNVVAYPTPRAMNPGMYQNSQTNQTSSSTDQRVFTGTVTKTHNDFGFVDHDVFYQTSVCAKGIVPKVNDRVLVEATYNPNMPFKWNATRVQVLPKTGPNQKSNAPKSNSYNAVPPPANKKSLPSRRDDRPPRRDERKRSRSRTRSRSRDRRDSRSRRDSPPRKRPIVHQPSPMKYVVRVPRMPLDITRMDVPALSQRYTNLYVPSDFFNAQVRWGETFPPQTPFSINNPCAYHIMSKEVENPLPNDAVLEPPDADYRFSAKVMLISMPTLEVLYQKCGLTKVDEKDKRSSNKNPLHPTRLIKFLVGQKGKGGENFAIGGPWSPSLDGENPQSDPKVLVKTAIRTCKALTGVDLSSCTQWYRMVEFYYWREGGGAKSRLECVVLFLPDVWSAQAPRSDWPTVQELYKAACDAPDAPPDADSAAADKSQIENKDLDSTTITIDENDDDEENKPEPTHYSKIDLKTIKVEQCRQELRARNASCKGLRAQLVSRLSKLLKSEEAEDKKSDDVMDLEDDEQEQDKKPDAQEEEKIEIKDEEQEKKAEPKNEKPAEKKEEKEKVEKEEKKTEKEIEEEKRKLEKEKQLRKSRYEIPSTPHILVHPSATAKGGKFNCSVATLSLLLDYRITDNKEHSFELFVFAELFNEMLMRDFGFYIYKTLYTLPEKAEEVKEKKETEDKSEKKAEEKKDEKKDDKRDEKREDRRDDKRDSRKRDRKESPSDDERSSSPKRRSRGVELPPDPYLLLSLVYFDTARGGSMTKKDLQNLFMSLGLQLSRSQIRAVLEKVCVKEIFNYKTLMQTIRDVASGSPEAIQDLPLDSTIMTSEVPTHIAELEETIASGNRNLLPIFKAPGVDSGDASGETKDVSESGMVMYKSRVVDVGALVQAEARGAAARARLEAALDAARAALRAARAAAASTQQAQRGAHAQLCDLTASLAAARARIASLTVTVTSSHMSRTRRAAAASTQQAQRGAHAQLCDLTASLAAARARIASLTVTVTSSHMSRTRRAAAASTQQAQRGAHAQLCDLTASLAAARARIASLTVTVTSSHMSRTRRAAAASTQQAQRGAHAQLCDLTASLAAARARIASLTVTVTSSHMSRTRRAAAASTQQAQRGAHAQLCDLTASLAAARARIASLTVTVTSSHMSRTRRAAAASTQQAQRGAHAQLCDLTASLAAARARIASLTASSKIFHSALKSIQSKVEAVVNIKYEDDDVVEIVNGPTQNAKETKNENTEKSEKEDSTNDDSTSKTDDKSEDVDESTDTNIKSQDSEITTAENMDLDDKE